MINDTNARYSATATTVASQVVFSVNLPNRDAVSVTNTSKTTDLLVGFGEAPTAAAYEYCIKPQQTVVFEVGILVPIYVISESSTTFAAKQYVND